MPSGPRIAGIDPGAHWIAVTVAEGERAPLRYVASLPLEIGRLVPLRKPKVKARQDGSTYTVTHRREITPADILSAVSNVIDFLERHGVSHAVVERVKNVHGGDSDSGRASRGRDTLLLRAQWIGGKIAGALDAAHRWDGDALVRSVATVEDTSSREWRANARKLARKKDEGPDAGGEAPSPSVAPKGGPHLGLAAVGPVICTAQPTPSPVPPQPPLDWPSAVRALLLGLPPDAGEHVLDAGGCAVYAVREDGGERVEAKPRASRKPKGPRRAPAPRQPKPAPPTCTCGPGGTPRPPGTSGRHLGTCPAAPPPTRRPPLGSAEAAAAYVPMTRAPEKDHRSP